MKVKVGLGIIRDDVTVDHDYIDSLWGMEALRDMKGAGVGVKGLGGRGGVTIQACRAFITHEPPWRQPDLESRVGTC